MSKSIQLVFFASIRETLGVDSQQVELNDNVETLADLQQQLAARGEPWRQVMADTKLLMAVNQEMTNAGHPLADGDEVAFFPPVTGG